MDDIRRKAQAIVEKKILPAIGDNRIRETSITLDEKNVYPIVVTFMNNEQMRFNVKDKDMSMAILGALSKEMTKDIA